MTPTDAELNEKVAAIAGWKPTRGDLEYCAAWERTSGEKLDPFKLWPSYATDLNAVVPVMEKEWWWFVEGGRQGRCHAFIDFELCHNKQVEATAPTLARACCLALVAAHEGENKSL